MKMPWTLKMKMISGVIHPSAGKLNAGKHDSQNVRGLISCPSLTSAVGNKSFHLQCFIRRDKRQNKWMNKYDSVKYWTANYLADLLDFFCPNWKGLWIIPFPPHAEVECLTSLHPPPPLPWVLSEPRPVKIYGGIYYLSFFFFYPPSKRKNPTDIPQKHLQLVFQWDLMIKDSRWLFLRYHYGQFINSSGTNWNVSAVAWRIAVKFLADILDPQMTDSNYFCDPLTFLPEAPWCSQLLAAPPVHFRMNYHHFGRPSGHLFQRLWLKALIPHEDATNSSPALLVGLTWKCQPVQKETGWKWSTRDNSFILIVGAATCPFLTRGHATAPPPRPSSTAPPLVCIEQTNGGAAPLQCVISR